ncbi:type IV-A pilus assembly ATPase PilB [Hahella sp. KA22]|uniref:type IV-A pilus assembly ATPase PilB n=1 Tax=Hahella sp. KA22 TaxID=1628392 RepID=UPI000FDF3FAF|nr:type IV-A pilus assembly ATPase PilB [Hahella sp. KA22]AZZ90893.1 type IV-A pilus assembly ATPase PilB [Hahella sp. KA22]QAY54263.1 type IV-A pilus assembly ATPase PilB [Hahella sp. KA22]
MNTQISPPLTGLARRFVQDGLLEESVAREAQANAQKSKDPFVSYIVKQGLANATQLAYAASAEFGVPLMDLSGLSIEQIPDKIVDEKLIRKHHALPIFKRGNRLFLAVADPTNLQALDEIKFHTGLGTDAILVEEDKLSALIEKYLDSHEQPLGDLGDTELDDIDIDAGDEPDRADDSGPEQDDAPIVKYINKMLLDAIKGGASDIHFEPYEKSYRVRFRTDGILNEVSKPSIKLAAKLAARLKVMSQLDISERRVPQDGRIKMKLSKTKAIDFRVNTLPTLWGEKIVLRILDPSSAKLGIDALGYEEDQKKMYLDALAQPQGMILVTGPTGSGKTVSLYTGLNILNTTERNISTAEDPVEINLEGVNQVNVNTRVGLDFSSALRAFLRQDPDVVMVGEIRDLDTASIAIKAAQTGHLVLSTLHTNSAAETLTRLRNMGVPAFNIATSVSLIIAQRLARRLCSECKETITVPNDVLKEEGFTDKQIETGFKLYRPKGCDKCKDGYKGRVGIYEVVRITPAMQELIMNEASSLELAKQAQKEGFRNLRQSALRKVIEGVTSLEEANRVTKD